MFNVISKYTSPITNGEITSHSNNTHERYSVYKYILSTKFVDCFIVDKGHVNGLEIHCINEYGLIYIYNKRTLKLVTIISPRPAQIKRYYIALELTTCEVIKNLIKISYERNTDRNFNNA